MQKFMAVLAALALGVSTLAPAPAFARDRGGHGGYYGGGHRGYHGGFRHRHHDDGDAIAAGIVGLALGMALGAAASQSNDPPPPRYSGYPGEGYGKPDPYYNEGSYYDEPPPADYRDAASDDGRMYQEGPNSCIREVRQWDPYSGRYVWVNLRTPCD